MQFYEDLPLDRRAKIDWVSVREELVNNPGQWALIAEDVAQSTVGQIRAGKNKQFRDDADQFEFASRRPVPAEGEAPLDPKRSNLWGRYVGPTGATGA